MTRWMAVYRLQPNGPRIESIRVRPANSELIDEWVVAAPVGLVGSPTPGTFLGVEVLQDLGESIELTTRQTRRLQPSLAIRMAKRSLSETLGDAPPWATDVLGYEWRATIQQLAASGPSSRKRVLAATAGAYVAAIDAGDRTPVATVAQQLGLRQQQVRDRLYKARQLGLLEPREAGRGRARGTLTEAAIALLRTEGSK